MKQQSPATKRLAKAFFAAMRLKRLSQKDVARITKMSPNTIWRIANGFDCRITSIDAIARALKLKATISFD